ncbi:AAA family ATPase [Chryseosolibacter indicus]|uniref:AAA family ATPase n=1 Tax=Chryseosolibacter indicus TaxID=2782351 RepID=A0ABS5VWR7_9BACT|nr:AAA family ATPase [Chryseosolibacter indicus]MBT1705870.1 AAA family ATPase [Chryseosolibacter indicus]
MKIKSIEVNNYKAFYGNHTIPVNGKNVFIYGENGSGKSSLYYALKDFFQSSIEVIDLNEVENIFIDASDKGKSHIKVVFNPDKDGNNNNSAYECTATSKNTDSTLDTSIKDANNLKSFLTYKHLLDIHHIKRGEEIDLFGLLVKGVLKHFKYTLTGGKELGALWKELEDMIAKPTDRTHTTAQKKSEVDRALKTFNDAFKQLFEEPTAATANPEYILSHATPILDLFEHSLKIKLRYLQAVPNADYTAFERNQVRIDLQYAGKAVIKPHLFLNEARLSAIAISIYLGMIKRHPQLRNYKLLFLDDIFIGLDISNRLPLMNILESHFGDYQIFITTYDKPWYEYVKSFLEGRAGWMTLEFYATQIDKGYEIPRILDNNDYIARAEKYLQENDYKCAAVYARTAFERELQKFCDRKGIAVKYHKQVKKYASEHFWNAIKSQNHMTQGTISDIEQFRDLVLNAFSHYNTEKHEIKKELQKALNSIKSLKGVLDAIA